MKTKCKFNHFDRFGKKRGLWIYKFKNLKIQRESNFQNNLLHGVTKVYSEKGILIDEINYEFGKPHGTWTDFSHSGIIRSKIEYEQGKKHGSYKSFICGKLFIDSQYINDNQIGIVKEYDVLDESYVLRDIYFGIKNIPEGEWLEFIYNNR